MTDENEKPEGKTPDPKVSSSDVPSGSTMNAPMQEDFGEKGEAGAADVPSATRAKKRNVKPKPGDAGDASQPDGAADEPSTTKKKPRKKRAVNAASEAPQANPGAAVSAKETAKETVKEEAEAPVAKPARKAASKAKAASGPVQADQPVAVTPDPKEESAPSASADGDAATPAPKAQADGDAATPTTAAPAPSASADGDAAKPAPAKPAPKASADGDAATPATKAQADGDAAKAAPATPAPKAEAAGDPAPSPKPAPAKAAPATATTAATAAKKAPTPPDPRVEEAKAVAERVKAAIVEKLGPDSVEEVGAAHFKPMVWIRRQDWLSAVETLRTHEEWKLNYIECMAGTDYSDHIEVVIFVQSTALGHFVCLKTRTPRDNAEVPSLVSSHPGVNWEEREIYDLLGVTFTNHPDLRRIMMWDEFTGHPLRKDYSEWE